MNTLRYTKKQPSYDFLSALYKCALITREMKETPTMYIALERWKRLEGIKNGRGF